ncbi:venom allergen 5.01-like [Coccinella septempunctata]|uniref:venom allergen 5.01-like n=1 Tax=Coccinella septempunctata TaxID=41139 RepID=UPI001D08326F|nr:venom allergen 5.01-like [Coccinella septempunctata]
MKIIEILFTTSYLVDFCASKCPNGINGYGMTEKARIDVLFWHKHYRSELVEGLVPNLPKAKEMPEMFYDAELETEAQYFANHCHYEYENVTTKSWGLVGINLHIQVSKNFDRRQEWAQVVYEWWHEQDMYYFGKSVITQAKHFGQIIWAKTENIGCGFTIFPIKHPNLILFHKFYVCAYAPKGNIPGELPYEVVSKGKN